MRATILNTALLGFMGVFASAHAAQAHGSIGFSFGFGPPAVYPVPPPVYYPPSYRVPAPVYSPPPAYYYEPRRYYRPPVVQYAPPPDYYSGYARPGYVYRYDDDDDDDDD